MLVLLLTTALVVAAALVLATHVAQGSVTSWLVAAYVIAFAEIVVVGLALSLVDAFTRWPLLAATAAVLALALVGTRPLRLPPVGAAARSLRAAVRDPVVAVVAAVAAGVVGYSFALAVFRPPNDEDAIAYHLVKAAIWAQNGAIGHVAGARDARVDEWVSNSEIVEAFTMVASGTGRYAPLLQLVAALAAAVAVVGIARRIGLQVRESLLGGLLFLTAPVVALQASTALNDVVVGSLAACAAYFLLGSVGRDLLLGGLAAALLVGTKLTGTLCLPGLALVALLARRQRPVTVLAVLAGAAVVGAYWYAFNAAAGRDAFGGVGGERTSLEPLAMLARVSRLFLAAIELPGAVGLDVLLYLVVAAVVGALLYRTTRRPVVAAAGAAVALLPLVAVGVEKQLLRGTQKAWFAIGREELALDAGRSATTASPLFSWYGAAGALLTILALVLVAREVRRRRLPPVALALAAAPVLWVILVGIGIPYWEWNGRYAIGGFALGAATWGVVLRLPPAGAATAAVVGLTAVLAFVHLHDRASGLRLLEPVDDPSVWTQPDWSLQATDNAHLRALYRFVERRVPEDAVVAVEPEVWPGPGPKAGNLPVYPFFGRDLTRTLHYADSPAAAARTGAGWAVLHAGDEQCAGWHRAFRYGGWIVLRRDPGSSC